MNNPLLFIYILVNRKDRVRRNFSRAQSPYHYLVSGVFVPLDSGREPATLERSNVESDDKHVPSWQTRDLIETLIFYFRLFPLFLTPIEILPVTKLSRVARYVKLVQQKTKIAPATLHATLGRLGLGTRKRWLHRQRFDWIDFCTMFFSN